MRPDVGVQAQFRKKKPPKTYRYDSSLSPSLEWDENPAREQGEALIGRILSAESLEDAKAAAEELKAMSRPFLNWAGKAERQAFEVLVGHMNMTDIYLVDAACGVAPQSCL